MASEHSESIARKDDDNIKMEEECIKDEVVEITDHAKEDDSEQNLLSVTESKTCDENKVFPLPRNEEAVLLATDMHNIIVPVKKNGTARLPVSYLKARQNLLRNKKITNNTNIITVRSSVDNSIKEEKNEIENCDTSSSLETSFSLMTRISKSFVVAAAEENKRTIIVNQGLEGSNLPTKRKLADGFFAEVPDKDNPGKLVTYYVIPTESSVDEIVSQGKRFAMAPRLKDRPSYLLEPFPEPDFEISIDDESVAGQIIKQLCKNKFSARMVFNSYIQSLIEDPDHRLVFNCQICSQSFWNKPACIYHYKKMHPGENFHACSVCHERFKTIPLLLTHKNSVHAENNICELCGKSFQNHNALIYHLKIHPNKTECNFCDYKIEEASRERYMEKHKRNHYRKAKYLKKSLFDLPKPWCDLCQIALESDKHLEVHNRIRHTKNLLQPQNKAT